MYLKEIIASINTDTREKAETLLKTEGFMSLQDFEGGYEAFIATQNGFLLPQIVFAHDYSIIEYECQCRNRNKKDFCVHLTAMLLGIEKMLEAGCFDYHEAVQKLGQH